MFFNEKTRHPRFNNAPHSGRLPNVTEQAVRRQHFEHVLWTLTLRLDAGTLHNWPFWHLKTLDLEEHLSGKIRCITLFFIPSSEATVR